MWHFLKVNIKINIIVVLKHVVTFLKLVVQKLTICVISSNIFHQNQEHEFW